VEWIKPPKGCCDGERPSIITSAGKGKQEYIDGAVMLGLSLQWHVPEFPRLCLVADSMSADNKQLLKAAGWTLLDIEEPQEDVLAKMNVFRVHVSQALWMDADMYVWDDPLREVLEDTDLKQGQIAMVKDAGGSGSNTGLMLLQPSLKKYAHLFSGAKDASDSDSLDQIDTVGGSNSLDQLLINKAFDGNVVRLETRFNTHGSIKPCADVVAAHYTGKKKPTLADAKNLQMVSKGYQTEDSVYLKCPILYKQYFCALKNAVNYLSKELQDALKKAGSEASCQIY